MSAALFLFPGMASLWIMIKRSIMMGQKKINIRQKTAAALRTVPASGNVWHVSRKKHHFGGKFMINQKRMELLAEELKKLGLDAMYLGPSTDLEYISGLDTHPDERVRGLMVSKDGRCFAMTPLLYKEEMVNAFGDVPFYAEWNDHEGFTGAFRRGCEHLGVVGERSPSTTASGQWTCSPYGTPWISGCATGQASSTLSAPGRTRMNWPSCGKRPA